MVAMVVYDSANKTLRSNKNYFSNRPKKVNKIDWRPEISVGAHISSGATLATVFYIGGATEPLNAPAGCDGKITILHEDILYEVVHEEAVDLLELQ